MFARMGENGNKRILFHAALPHHFVFFQSVYERLAEDARLDWFWSSNFLGWQLKKHLFDLFPVKGKKVASFAAPARLLEAGATRLSEKTNPPSPQAPAWGSP